MRISSLVLAVVSLCYEQLFNTIYVHTFFKNSIILHKANVNVSSCFGILYFISFPVVSHYFLPIPLSKYDNRHHLVVTV